MIFPELEGKQYNFLVTGGAGFIGSNLAIELLRSGQRVVVLDNLSTGSRRNLVDIEGSMKDTAASGKIPAGEFVFIEGDIRDLGTCRRAVEGADFVLHNAALGSVPRSIEDPVTTTEVNVMGTLNMLVAARDSRASGDGGDGGGGGVRRFVYASSSSVYGDSPHLPKVEGEEGEPLSPYAVSKLVGETYASGFHRLFALETVGLRYFNVFGPRQDPHSLYAAVIPIFVKALLKGEAPTIFGDGSTSRDFTFVDNVVRANVKAAFAPPEAAGGVYNIACGSPLSLNALYAKLSEVLGKDTPPLYGPERKGDVRHSDADITKAREFLGYTPEVDAGRGLEMAVEWLKENA